jgi:hypothetical protein
MRTISIKQEIEQVVLQYVRAIPEVFSTYDIAKVELVVQNNYDGLVYDIVFVESDETELVIGDLTLGTDLSLDIEIYPDEDELELTLDQIFQD